MSAVIQDISSAPLSEIERLESLGAQRIDEKTAARAAVMGLLALRDIDKLRSEVLLHSTGQLADDEKKLGILVGILQTSGRLSMAMAQRAEGQ